MKKLSKKNAVTAYKVFDPDWTCKGFKFAIGKTYKHEGKVKICQSGFHACTFAGDCFSYYSFIPTNKVAEVRVWGETDENDGDTKLCGSQIEIVREIAWPELLTLANLGKDNTGHSNTGDRNSGDSNSGDRNSGDSNSGSWNSGSWNSGDSNSGSWNSGDSNSGYRNSGDRNSGSWNSGDRNSGDSNSGDRNSGSWNSGSWNSGDRNSGDSNSGSWNSGDRNSGDSNSGYRNSGAFCTDANPEVWLFDQPSGIKVQDWERHPAVRILNNNLETHLWIYANSMSDAEKEANPNWETRDGYLKAITLKEAWVNMWPNLDEKSRKIFYMLPNFDPLKFMQITGIDVKVNAE
jgi:hypothetical protein